MPPTTLEQLQRLVQSRPTTRIVRSGVTRGYGNDMRIQTGLEAMRHNYPDQTFDVDLLTKPTSPTLAEAMRKAAQQRRFR